MKHIYVKFFAATIVLLVSCNGSYSPKLAAENFLTAFSQKKFDEAKKYCTPETVKLVEIAESLTKMSSAKTDFTGKEYEVLSQDIRGENAIVNFKEKGSDKIQKINLKYTGNQWLVSISKEDVMSKQNTEKDFNNGVDSTKTN